MSQFREAIKDSTVGFFYTLNASAGGAVDPSDAFEAADFRIYKDGGTTERASTSGYTVTNTFDTVTGLGLFEVDLSDNTTAGFFEVGSQYDIMLIPDTETVDGQSVVAKIGTFIITDGSKFYPDGFIYVDTVNGVNGTVIGEHGTMGNPTSTLANARVMAEAMGNRQIRIVPGSSATAASSFANYRIEWLGATLDYGSQSFDSAVLVPGATSGSYTGTPRFVYDIGRTSAEPTGAPSTGTDTILALLEWIAHFHTAEINQTSSGVAVRDNADSSDIATATYSNNGVSVVRGMFS
jgi:hypothetical protein